EFGEVWQRDESGRDGHFYYCLPSTGSRLPITVHRLPSRSLLPWFLSSLVPSSWVPWFLQPSIPSLLISCSFPATPARRLGHPAHPSLIVHDTLPNGVRLVTESMPHVRSVSLGVWLARGSRHESAAQSGMAHLVE